MLVHTYTVCSSIFSPSQLYTQRECLLTDKISVALTIFFHDLVYDQYGITQVTMTANGVVIARGFDLTFRFFHCFVSPDQRKDLEERSAVEFLDFAQEVKLVGFKFIIVQWKKPDFYLFVYHFFFVSE
jgi:hypothetical protein